MNVLGQTTELTGASSDNILLSGRNENKFDINIDRHQSVKAANDIANYYHMDVNNNIIDMNNNLINNSLVFNLLTDTKVDKQPNTVNKLLLKPIGVSTPNITINRK